VVTLPGGTTRTYLRCRVSAQRPQVTASRGLSSP
jgi:hypothetical protein